ncbi:MAG: ABC transporter ATP-binding protein [Trueperaceae bacterium]
MPAPLLDVADLKTHFFTDDGVLKAVDGVSFQVGRAETLGIIGESGCGKSITAQSVLRIVPRPGRVVGGSIRLNEEDGSSYDLARLPAHGQQLRSIRGSRISMIFQEPMTSLSPVHTIGNQIMESLLLHRTRSRREAKAQAIAALDTVGMPNPKARIDAYPHELSGGLRQRAMIAMALSCDPALLIADEPTTALDVTIQAQILALMAELKEQTGMSMLFITHDLGVIAEIADRVAVMYLGKIVETGTVQQIFDNPLHPYTRKLLKSVPKLGEKRRGPLEAIEGTVPIPMNLPRQCPFFDRCPDAMPGVCDVAMPELTEPDGRHPVRCFLHHREVEEAEVHA